MRAKAIVTMLTITGMLAGAGSAAGQGRNRGQGPAAPAPGTAQLTAVETENILHMREEEKLARDVYLTLAEMWDCPVFTNIAASEQRHMAAVGLLLDRYGQTDPVTDDTVGVFSKPEFTALYASLTESGAKSLLDALQVGVQIEELDIADLDKALSETDKSDIQWVFSNLKRGSSNHLRAFTRNIETDGTGCLLQGTAGNDGRGLQGANNAAGRGRGRGGRGNGGGGRFGHGRGRGSGNANGRYQQNQQQKRNGACMLASPAVPVQP